MRLQFVHFRLAMLSLFISFLFISCGEKSSNLVSNTKIPVLLDRNEKLRNGKEWDDVMNSYQKLKLAIQKNDDDQESKIRLAQLFIREARVTGEHGHYYNAALNMTDQILNSKSKNRDMDFLALVTKAGVQLSHHDFNGALITGKKAVVINPNNPQIFGVLVDANVELGNYSEAVKMADIMIAMKPDLRSYARISYIREIHGEVDQAFEAMKMAVEAGIPGYEDTAWAMLTLADMYKLYGQYDKAESIYKEILAQRQDYPFAIAALGSIYMKKGDMALAEKMTKDAIAIIPEVSFYTQLAEIYQKQGNTQAIDPLMNEIFAMMKNDEKSGHNMNLEYAHIYLDLMNDNDKALEYAQKEYLKRPENIDVNRMLARIYAAEKNKNMVGKYLVAATATHSKHPELIALHI
ncbi:MAG: tetratricopeptide repeat protein [Saprospiraceae bacterium]|nr:tetratricopeptide repeat protein [Saprospiraceae bacterium]